MRIATFHQALSYFFPTIEQGDRGEDPNEHERFGLPHTFKPHLGFFEAVIGTLAAVLRVLFGAFLFSVWGAYSLAAWTTWRASATGIALLLMLFLTFLLASALVFLAIGAMVNLARPHRR